MGHSLIAQAVLGSAVRALPGDAVARHAPEVFFHAHLADAESASAGPAKHAGGPAEVADIGPFVLSPVSGFTAFRGHGEAPTDGRQRSFAGDRS